MLVVVAFVNVAWSLDHFGILSTIPHERAFPDRPWFDGWSRWDAHWYRTIADDGYTYTPGQQSPVAFFPSYPLAMRALEWLFRDVLIAGIFITVACGFAVTWLFHRWCLRHLSAASARMAVLALLLYPYAYYLFGAAYGDALFVVAALGAFLLLEDDRPVLAGLVGVIATAGRPVGGAVVAGLTVVMLTRRGVLTGAAQAAGARVRGAVALGRLRIDPRRLRPKDLAVALSVLGLAGYCFYLWRRFDAPLAFVEQTGVPGWDQPPGPRTWFKAYFFEAMQLPQSPLNYVRLGSQAVFTVGALALVPAVIRRFGWGYGVYTLLVVGLPAVASKDFTGMGRYLLAAFPCYAVLGDWLAHVAWVRRLRVPLLAASAAALMLFISAFSRGYYLS
ncbi:MAG: hypothetical protein AVDCRST_MAG50-2390 [uncultured Acidimicrobiales bacterium]|uniref:Integral membrane protein n=1 Tax=uncultured Acidimicrobiales bacterium TaxID=310071 RepID=A0A6J4ILE6_9ACTN|nr:MAG: hypothetical protein AVDCRST_MAG50-2390 [uncultured Acidimicrobiales bacterium]